MRCAHGHLRAVHNGLTRRSVVAASARQTELDPASKVCLNIKAYGAATFSRTTWTPKDFYMLPRGS